MPTLWVDQLFVDFKMRLNNSLSFSGTADAQKCSKHRKVIRDKVQAKGRVSAATDLVTQLVGHKC